jgi:hypothetical protein
VTTQFCDLGATDEVDGVLYVRPFGQDSMWIRPVFEELHDHPDEVCGTEDRNGPCWGCDCRVPCCFEGHMRWNNTLPIIRFTSEGLQTNES